VHVANTEKIIAFKEVEVREEGVNDSSFTRGRGGRRGRGGGKSKGKQRADTEANEDAAAELSMSHTQSE
jgi:hypothetical protein